MDPTCAKQGKKKKSKKERKIYAFLHESILTLQAKKNTMKLNKALTQRRAFLSGPAHRRRNCTHCKGEFPMETLNYQVLEKSGYDGYILKNAPEKVLQFGEGNFLRAFVDYWYDLSNE